MDTVAFRGRILRDDEQRAKEEAAGAVTGEKAPEEGNAPESGNAPEKEICPSAAERQRGKRRSKIRFLPSICCQKNIW